MAVTAPEHMTWGRIVFQRGASPRSLSMLDNRIRMLDFLTILLWVVAIGLAITQTITTGRMDEANVATWAVLTATGALALTVVAVGAWVARTVIRALNEREIRDLMNGDHGDHDR